MRVGVLTVAPQKGLVIVQVPTPIAGLLSDVKIPPARKPISFDCAELNPHNHRTATIVTAILLKVSLTDTDFYRSANYKIVEVVLVRQPPALERAFARASRYRDAAPL